MEIKYKKLNESLYIYLAGELDEYTAAPLRTAIDDLLDKNINVRSVVFNLGGLRFMDSTGIGMLIGRYKKLKRLNIPLYLQGAPVSIEKILQLSGLYGIMPKI